ncbi:DEAD/DEAH box helicase, partial [Streptomyces sp. NPDC059525]|uniref:DEAD/DEAH box helicase n=1 Tax=Streptomyces sp. NPDC059525 TaxID=3346857 RepID=UPI0036A5FAC7
MGPDFRRGARSPGADAYDEPGTVPRGTDPGSSPLRTPSPSPLGTPHGRFCMKNPSAHGRFGIKAAASAGSRSKGGSGAGKAPRTLGPQGEFAMPRTATPALPPVESFGELGLPAELVETLAAQQMRDPFPIQAATLPNSLAGRDILGRGRTGSGKTLAFGLALL